MNCRNFLQFETMKPKQLVWKGETPAAAPAAGEKPGAEAPKEAKTIPPPAETAKVGAEAREKGDTDQQQESVKADKLLTESTAATTSTQEDIQKILAKYPEIQKLPENASNAEVLKLITDTADRVKVEKFQQEQQAAEEAKTEKKEDSDKTSDALKGVGLGALLERLIDKLTKLFDKLSVQIEKMFGSLEKKTASIKSPFGDDKKFTIARGYEAGKGLTIAANANEEIYSASSGTVTKVDSTNKIVEITKDDGSRTVYKNIEPSAGLKTGDDATKIESGKQLVIGKAVSGEGIGFQYFNKNNTEQDPTESFKKAELVEKEPDEPKPTPTAVAAGPTAPATGAPATTPK